MGTGRAYDRFMRIVLAVILVIHGVIHAMGFMKAFGFAEMAQLREPISKPMGLVWLFAGFLCVASAVMLSPSLAN